MGAFGKLFSEAIEATPARERETIIASGGGPWMGVRFGLLPQVLPVIASLPGTLAASSHRRSLTAAGCVWQRDEPAGEIGAERAALQREAAHGGQR